MLAVWAATAWAASGPPPSLPLLPPSLPPNSPFFVSLRPHSQREGRRHHHGRKYPPFPSPPPPSPPDGSKYPPFPSPPPPSPPPPSPPPPSPPFIHPPRPGRRPSVFDNVAVGKPCWQSSTPDNASCALALNNDTSSWAHTAAEAEPWLLVDLTRDHYVESVRLWNRAGSEAHLRDFYLAVTNSSDARTWPSSARHDAAVDDLSTRSISGHFDRRVQVHLGQVGRYVLVRRRHTGPLELAELEIFGEELLQSAFGGAAPTADDLELLADDALGFVEALDSCDDDCQRRLLLASAAAALVAAVIAGWRVARYRGEEGGDGGGGGGAEEASATPGERSPALPWAKGRCARAPATKTWFGASELSAAAAAAAAAARRRRARLRRPRRGWVGGRLGRRVRALRARGRGGGGVAVGAAVGAPRRVRLRALGVRLIPAVHRAVGLSSAASSRPGSPAWASSASEEGEGAAARATAARRRRAPAAAAPAAAAAAARGGDGE